VTLEPDGAAAACKAALRAGSPGKGRHKRQAGRRTGRKRLG
jgi:hypothetical protein